MESKYNTIKFSLTDAQLKKIKHGVDNKVAVSLRLSSDIINERGIPLLLTDGEVKKLKDGKQHNINISATRLKKLEKVGGFLPALVAAIPYIVSALGAAAAGTTIAKNVKEMVQGKGVISDLGIPIISPLAKMVGLGNKKLIGTSGCGLKKRGKGGVYLSQRGRGGVFLGNNCGRGGVFLS